MSQHPTGVHHIAMMAGDIKKHIAFFSEVVGFPLVALFDMHGVEGGLHAFLKMSDGAYFSIVQLPGVDDIPVTLGVTHAGRGEMPSARGTMQHLAFGVPDEAALLAMRDRIRSHGVNVMGPIHHGFCKSIYFAGPDNMALEISTSLCAVEPDRWIDPAVLAKAGIDAEEAARYRAPQAYDGPSPVAQPPYDPAKPHMTYPEAAYARMLSIPDEVIAMAPAYEPPVPEKATA
ncbi:MAG TPA: VOC family protein [Caulobacter sp.]|nr:VOC family protein [Caulobacter sp.]